MSSAGAFVVKQLIGKQLGSKAAVRSGNEIPKQLTLGYYSRLLSRICGLIPVPGAAQACDTELFP
jgi:hypothetical protein